MLNENLLTKLNQNYWVKKADLVICKYNYSL